MCLGTNEHFVESLWLALCVVWAQLLAGEQLTIVFGLYRFDLMLLGLTLPRSNSVGVTGAVLAFTVSMS
jgi:hypothetical protein